MADRPERDVPDTPRQTADPTRRRRLTIGRSARSNGSSRLGRGRHRRSDLTPEEQPETVLPADAVDAGSAAVGAANGAGETTDAAPEATTDAAQPLDAAREPTGESAPARSVRRGRDRLGSALSRPGRGQVTAAVLLVLFGFAAVTQVRITTDDSTYATARREDLIQLLDGLTQENRRLEGELSDLERTRTNLQSGADAQQVARQEAERRIEMLSILAGTVPAEGQGIRMVINDPQNKVTAEILLDAVEEMRDAGGEVIEVDDSIRLVASSWFGTGPTGLVVDGKPVTKPITIEVIGDPHSLSEGASFRGGIVSEITSSKVGGTVSITELDNVVIDSLHTPKPNQYARPASPKPTR